MRRYPARYRVGMVARGGSTVETGQTVPARTTSSSRDAERKNSQAEDARGCFGLLQINWGNAASRPNMHTPSDVGRRARWLLAVGPLHGCNSLRSGLLALLCRSTMGVGGRSEWAKLYFAGRTYVLVNIVACVACFIELQHLKTPYRPRRVVRQAA